MTPADADFRKFADGLPTLCWIANADGYIVWYNRRWHEYCGTTPEEMEGWGWQSVHDQSLLPSVLERWRSSIATGASFEMTFPLRGADGNYRPFLTRIEPVRDDHGQVIQWYGVNTDVSAQAAAEAALSEQAQTLELLNHTGSSVAGELELERVVQMVTDTGREITGAGMGAFFYNVLEDAGDAYMLFTLSGADRADFEKFGMPRPTAVFRPTFHGEGIIRSDDIQLDARYGLSAPHRGLPKNHLPVRSYLAVPVVSRAGEVIGGLFFGHPEPGRFTEAHEDLIKGLAGQAAVAIDNARLFGAAQREIVRREQAEAALVASESYLRLVLDSARVGFYAVDSEGVTTIVNAAFLEMLGFDDESEVVGRKLHNSIHHSHADGTAYPVEDCPVYKAARGEDSFRIDGEVFYRRDGVGVPVEYWAHPLPNGSGAVCIFADVSDRKAAQEAQERYQALLAAEVVDRTAERDSMWQMSQDLLTVATPAGELQAVSPSWKTVLGYPSEDLIGKAAINLIHPDDLPGALEVLAAAQSSPVTNFSARYRHKDGSYRHIAWTASVQGDRLYGSGRDVTFEREQAAALQKTEATLRQIQKMEAVGQLTGGIAHDFNNMLAVVIGNLDIAHRRLEQGESNIGRYLENIREGASRAAALTQRLLAFSRQQPLDPKVTDLNRLVGDMSELLDRTLGERVSLETVQAAGLWRTNVDRHQLENVIVNLAVNARDAMPDGGQLTIETANTHLDDAYAAENIGVAAGQYVLICVSDTGGGMDPETLTKVFDPFFTTKPVGKGTGLGLSMVYGFIKQTGGNVKIYTEPGQGTTVRIYLPRYHGSVEPVVASARRQQAPPAGKNETVLVVEDDPQVRRMSVQALTDLGYTVHQAGGGDEALEILGGLKRVDLLFTDVVMPGMTGRELADRVATVRPEIRVLYTTGYTRNAVVHNGVLDHGVALLAKPFNINDMALKVRAVLDEF